MTQPLTPHPTADPGSVVHLPIERKLDRQLDVCRHGAKTDRCTVVIERRRTDRAGNVHSTPVIEITPEGDVNEIPVATMRTSLGELFKAQYLDSLDGACSETSARAIDRMTRIAAESEHEIATLVTQARQRAKKDRERRDRQRQARADRRAKWEARKRTPSKEAA